MYEIFGVVSSDEEQKFSVPESLSHRWRHQKGMEGGMQPCERGLNQICSPPHSALDEFLVSSFKVVENPLELVSLHIMNYPQREPTYTLSKGLF